MNTMMKAIAPALVVVVLAACAGPASPAKGQGAKILKEGEQIEVDHLKVAATMIRDGEYDHAEKELQLVDATAAGVDLPRFHTLRGVVALHKQAYPAAKEAFRTAIASGQRDSAVRIYLAQVHYALSEWRETIDELHEAGEAQASFSSLHAMKIQCYWTLKDVAGAFGAIGEAERRFPNQTDFTRQRLYYLLHLGLFNEAEQAGRDFLVRSDRSTSAFLAVGESFRRYRQHEAAAKVLEEGRLRYPAEDQILVTLARTYLDQGRYRSAGQILEEVAARDPKYASEAAELYRRSGDIHRALYINSGLTDQKAKARQRLGLLLESERYEEAVSLAPRLERLALYEDEDVRYALAFANYRSGHFDRAEEHLKTLTRPELFKASAELRKAIEIGRAGIDH